MEEMTLLARLAKLFPEASKTTLRKMVETKRVRINGTVARSVNLPIAQKDRVEVADSGTAAAATEATILAGGLRLVHFDADIAVVEKPAGLLTATDLEEKRPTAWRILTDYFRRQNGKNRTFLVHRLDRDASGLLVFARSSKAQASLKRQFFAHTVTRRYDAIVHGIPKPASGHLEQLLLENPHTGIVGITTDAKKGKLAVLDYQTIHADQQRKITHLQCTLHTGRKHQIRVLMKSIGHAVCGDPVYGTADEPPNRLALHAGHLGFEHPRTGKLVSWDSAMPGSFSHMFRMPSAALRRR